MNQRGGRGFSDYRGRSPRPAGGGSPQYRAPDGADGHLVDESLGITDGMFRDGRTNPQQRSRGGVSRHFEPKPVYRPKQPAFGGSPGFSNVVRYQSSASPTSNISKPSESADSILAHGDAQFVPKDVHLGASDLQNGDKTGYSAVSEKVKVNIMAQQDESRLHSESGVEVGDSLNKGTKNSEENGDSGHSEQGGRTNPNHRPQGGVSKYFEPKPSSGNLYRQKQPASRGGAGFSSVVRRQNSASPTCSVSKPSESADSILARGDAQSVPKDVHLGASDLQNGDKTGYSAFSEKVKVNVMAQQDESKFHSKSGAGVGDFLNKGTKNSEENGGSGHSEQGGRTNPHHRPQGGVSKHFEPNPSSGNTYRQRHSAFRGGAGFSNVVRHQSSANPTNSVSKPSESADSILARGDGIPLLSAQSAPKDVRLGATEPQNGDKSGYSASQHDKSKFHSKSGAGVGDFLNKGTKNSEENGGSGHSEQGGRTNPHHRPHGGVSKHFEPKPSSGNTYRQRHSAFRGGAGFSNVVRHQSSASPTSSVSKPSESADSILGCGDGVPVLSAQSVPKDVRLGATVLQNGDKSGYSTSRQDESRFHSKSGTGVGDSLNKGTENTAEHGDLGNSEHGGRINPHEGPQGGVSKHFELKPSSGYMHRQKQPAFRGGAGFSSVVRHQQGQSSSNPTGVVSKPSEHAASALAHEDDLSILFSWPVPKDVCLGAREFQNVDKTGYNAALQLDVSEKVKVTPHLDESRLHSKSDAGVGDSLNKGPNNTKNIGDSGHSEDVKEIKHFDICPSKSGTSINLKPSLLEQNKEKRRSLESHGSVLRSGMVLLKNFLSLNDQVKIVKQCRDLGIGSGGFYQPGFGDGRELHLKMMCLGKNWDPETSSYGDFRPHDSTTPPKIPGLFNQFVLKAIEDSHTLIRKNSKLINVQNVLPSMSPNICIVNFYTSSGRLGLHKDKDETTQSLIKGLPVVSFSIGDSAEFLYGDEMDVDKAEKVELESGDLLIFGGKARHIFHGVTSIRPNTAPKALLKETNLRPGRLNLTFREY